MPQYNTFPYNTAIYNGGVNAAEVFSDDPIVFDGFSLSNGVDIIASSLKVVPPARQLIGGNIPRDDGMYLNAEFWRNMTVVVEGHLTTTSSAALEALMDTVKKGLRRGEQPLDTTLNGVVRRFIATLTSTENLFPMRQHFHTVWLPFTATFECRTPFATDREQLTQDKQFTVSPQTDTVANGGTIEALPIFVLVFNAAVGVTKVNVQNDNTTEAIELETAISAGDVVVFDSEQKTVKLNGVLQDYNGAFPKLDVDSNVIRYTVTGTSFDIRATVKYLRRYL